MLSLQRHDRLPPQAVILAAGRGERLRPLTDTVPKPLIEVAGRPVLDHHIERLCRAGIRRCVINIAHLGGQIEAHVHRHWRDALDVVWSREPPGALETGGGLRQALALLASGPFLAINADIYCDFDLEALRVRPASVAHLVLVPNPATNSGGDFHLAGELITNDRRERETFAGIAVYEATLLSRAPAAARFPLTPLLRAAADAGEATGQRHTGMWFDIGTPTSLEAARRQAGAGGRPQSR